MSSVIIITGMHRSATSLIASLFERAGVHLGDQLLASDATNPRGFFEDIDFYAFHQNALRLRGESIFVTRNFTFSATPAEEERAAQLIAARAARPLWGWKDPRTSLLLEFWRERLPHAHFILLYRHPLDVLLSLLRRQENQLTDWLQGLEAWYAYNKAITDFQSRYPAQTLLCHSYAVVQDIEAFSARLRERFNLDLQVDAAVRDALYRPDELRRAEITLDSEAVLRHVHPEAMALYAQMNESADLPYLSPVAQPTAASHTVASLAAWSAAHAKSSVSLRRGLLIALLGLIEPELLESFLQQQARDIMGLLQGVEGLARDVKERDAMILELSQQVEWLARERAGWERLADEREQVILDQQAWAKERLAYLKRLEERLGVRLLKRMGLA